MFRDRGVEIKTPAQIDLMRAAGLVVGRTLDLLSRSVVPGMTTLELDRIAEDSIRSAGATPSFLGYGDPPFPGSICVSVNDEVVHGVPGSRVVRDGDIVSIDCGAIVDGWHGDAAVTVAVGEVPAEALELMRVTEESMWRGFAAAALGGHVGDISHAVEQHVRSQGDYGIVPDYTGHGIGSAMHQPPNVPNHGKAGRGVRLVEGLALAVEPMIVAGDPGRTWPTTTGPSAPTTRRWPRTSSTPSPSPRPAPGCSPPSTAGRPGSPSSASPSAAADACRFPR